MGLNNGHLVSVFLVFAFLIFEAHLLKHALLSTKF